MEPRASRTKPVILPGSATPTRTKRRTTEVRPSALSFPTEREVTIVENDCDEYPLIGSDRRLDRRRAPNQITVFGSSACLVPIVGFSLGSVMGLSPQPRWGSRIRMPG